MFDQLYNAFQPVCSPKMSGFLRCHSCRTDLVTMPLMTGGGRLI